MAAFAGPRIVTDGLIMHLDAADLNSYPGSGSTWYDLTGNRNNGTLQASPTFSPNYVGSIGFNTASNLSQYVSVPSSASIPLSGTNFSMDTWMQFSNYGYSFNNGYTCQMFSTTGTSSASGGNFGFQWYINGNGSSWSNIGLYANNGSIYTTLASTWITNTWYYLTLTHTSTGNFTVYLNGNQIWNFTNASGWTDNTPYAIARNNQSGYEDYFPGYISSFRIYNQVLTAAQVQQNFRAHRGRYGV
jgi:hypothetical protein